MARGRQQPALTFGAGNLRRYGGIYLVHRFLTRIGFEKAVLQSVCVGQRNNRYSLAELLVATSYSMTAGLERLETA